MNTDRTIILQNVSDQPIGLKDTQSRMYRLGVGGRIRISLVSLQDIMDYPASKIIFKEGLAKISNVTIEALYNMGLTEDEIKDFTIDVYEEVKETSKEESPVVEDKKSEEEVSEEKIETKTAAKKTTTTKKTSTTKKASSTKKVA